MSLSYNNGIIRLMVEITGHLAPIPETYPLLWEQFRTDHTDLFGLLSRMGTSFVIRSFRDREFDARANLSVIDLLEKRFGFGVERNSVSQLAGDLGMTTSGISTLTQGILGYISLETGLHFNSPSGINALWHVNQVQDLVQQQRKLERRIKQGVGPLEAAAIRFYLIGLRFDDLTARLNTDLDLNPPVGETLVTTIIRQALGEVDYRAIAFLRNKALRASGLLKDTEMGIYKNHKAWATDNILNFMAGGATQAEIIDETGIRGPDYNALVNEVFIDLEDDEVGREELEGIHRMVSSELSAPLVGKTKNKAARLLLEPYRSFRMRLGERLEDGELTCNRLSPREKAILEAIALGSTSREIAGKFRLGDTYYTAVSRWLLNETEFVSQSELLQERRKMFTNLQDDIKRNKPISKNLLTFAGLPSTVVLRYLSEGLLIEQVKDAISEQTGLDISRHKIMDFYARIRAHYRSV